MLGILTLLAGYGLGVLHMRLADWVRGRYLDLPPATARQIERARRASIRPALARRRTNTAATVGVVVKRWYPDAAQAEPLRSIEEFDGEPTR